MAEIIAPQKNGRRKTQAPRIDLTPMVDLGFLLITFFMFTTSLANQKALELKLPDNTPVKEQTVFAEEATITVVPVNGHLIKYFNGTLGNATHISETPIAGIRTVLLQKQSEVATLPATYSANAHLLHVLIKPSASCTYADVVNLLDEMNILNVQYYALVDLSKEEQEQIMK